MLIGITGKARSGKDTFAELLANALFDKSGQRFVLMAYAHELKLRVQKDFDLSYEQLWGDEKEEYDRRYPRLGSYVAGRRDHDELRGAYWTPREILQEYGQFFRTIHHNFWVDELFRVIEDKEYKNVIITDVRHPNEADPIKERGGCIIRVSRFTKNTIHGADHISETAMDDYQAEIDVINNGGLEELKQIAQETVEELKKISGGN